MTKPDFANTALREAVDVLGRSETEPVERIEHVEWILGNREATIEDALVAFAISDEHVLLVEEGAFAAFEALCTAAADRDHDVTISSVIDRSIEEHGDTDALREAILDHDGLDDATRTSRLDRFDDETATVGESVVGDSAVTPGVDSVFEVSDEGHPSPVQDRSDTADERSGTDLRPTPNVSPENSDTDTTSAGDSEDEPVAPDRSSESGASDPDESSAEPSVDEPQSTDDSAPDGESPESSDGPPTPPVESEHTHTGRLDPPQRSDPTVQGALSIPNYVRDLIDFEYVLDGADPTVPSDVNETGVVLLDDGHYVGLMRVRPRTWSIHTETEKSRIVDAYRSSFLATLDFPIQIVSYPSKFDISDHVRRLEEVLEADRAESEESDLLTIGRELYPNWLERFILDNDMKQRQFYVAVPVSAEKIAEENDPHTGLLDTIGETVPPLEGLTDWLGGSDVEVSDEQCLRELDSRLSRIASALRRVDISSERVDDRTEALSVCYHYYNNERPEDGTFPTGPYAMTRRGDDR